MVIKNIVSDRRLIIFVVLAIMFINSPVVYGNQDSSLELILPNGTAQLYDAIEIKDVQYYRDGGTTGITLRDKNGKEFQFCLDGRIQAGNVSEPAKPYHIYFGGTHPDVPGAQSIPIGGKEEKSLLNVLQKWVDTHLDLKEKDNKFYYVFEVIKVLKNR